MSAPLQLRVVRPPIDVEFEPPGRDFSEISDEQVRQALESYAEEQDLFLEGLWRQLVDGVNWAGPLRVSGGRLYRYDGDANEWLSFARPDWHFGKATPANPIDQLDIVGGITTAASVGYWIPQDCTAIRWWARWTPTVATPAGFTLNLRRTGGVVVQAWVAVGGEVSMGEDILVNVDAGQQLSVDVAGNTDPATDLSVGLELAWRTTFEA